MKRKRNIFFLAFCIMLSIMPVTAWAKETKVSIETLEDADSHTKTAPSDEETESVQTEKDLSEETEGNQQEETDGKNTEPPEEEEPSHRTESPIATEPPIVTEPPQEDKPSSRTEMPHVTKRPGQEGNPSNRTNPPKTEGDSHDNPKDEEDEENKTDKVDEVETFSEKTETATPQTTSTPNAKTETAGPLSTGAVEAPETADDSVKRGAKAAAKVLLDREQRKTFFGEYPWIPIMLKVLLCILLTYLVSDLSKKMWYRNPKNNTMLFRKFIFNISQVIIYLVGGLCAIGQIPMLSNVVQTVLAGSGIFALAVSLSAQESIKSILGGFFITIFKPIEVGDRITLVNSKITGDVEDITLRHTIIRTFTNTRIVVPNATVNDEIIENSNIVDAKVSSFVDIWVAYESDIDQAMEIMASVIGSHPLYLDIRTEEEKETVPKVTVYVRELGGSGIALRASMWTTTVSENYTACSEVRLQIKKSFDAAGIEIPYTKYTILQQKPHTDKGL